MPWAVSTVSACGARGSQRSILSEDDPTFTARTRDGAFGWLGMCFTRSRRSVGPLPVAGLRHVVAMLRDVLFVPDELVAQGLLGVHADPRQPRDALDHIGRQVESVEVVQHRHVERG